jgi:hypothetical protein
MMLATLVIIYSQKYPQLGIKHRFCPKTSARPGSTSAALEKWSVLRQNPRVLTGIFGKCCPSVGEYSRPSGPMKYMSEFDGWCLGLQKGSLA